MKPELQKQLFDKYPAIFVQRNWDMTRTCMVWGLDCGDGWFKLLDDCCAKLTKYCFLSKLDVQAVQVKEKFGTLHFYVDGGDEIVDDIVGAAEHLSEFTCEECGDHGRPSRGTWTSVRCDSHHRDYDLVVLKRWDEMENEFYEGARKRPEPK